MSGTDWFCAVAGEIVDRQTFSSLDTYFFKDNGDHVNEPITVDSNGESIYLAFKTILWGEEYTRTGIEPYGWVELYIQDENIMLVSSAVDIDGGPMIVGGGAATPEPTSGMLMLLGMLGLLLRRQSGGTRG